MNKMLILIAKYSVVFIAGALLGFRCGIEAAYNKAKDEANKLLDDAYEHIKAELSAMYKSKEEKKEEIPIPAPEVSSLNETIEPEPPVFPSETPNANYVYKIHENQYYEDSEGFSYSKKIYYYYYGSKDLIDDATDDVVDNDKIRSKLDFMSSSIGVALGYKDVVSLYFRNDGLGEDYHVIIYKSSLNFSDE